MNFHPILILETQIIAESRSKSFVFSNFRILKIVGEKRRDAQVSFSSESLNRKFDDRYNHY